MKLNNWEPPEYKDMYSKDKFNLVDYVDKEEEEEEFIWRNICKCLLCDDIIESKYTHDFVKCKCGAIFTDGGNRSGYVRRGGNIEAIQNIKKRIDED